MKLTTIILITTLLQVSASTFAQKITFQEKGIKLGRMFKEIRKQTGYDVLLYAANVKSNVLIDANFKGAPIDEVMKQILLNTELTYAIEDRTIIVRPKDAKPIVNEVIQRIEIKGKVVDDEERGLPGVSIRVKGTNTGVISSSNGDFSINVNKGQTLVFTYVGFETKEVVIGDQTTIDLMLKPLPNALQEVVISYGTQRSKEITGSIVTVNVSSLPDMPVLQLAQKLQGKLAGVEITQPSGRPGAALAFRVRGAASINASNAPLYVVDGQSMSDINHLNPDEVETVTVLKDASATALYGSRAAGGVILITTKQAKPGEPRIDFNAYYGTQKLDQSNRYPVMTAQELATWYKGFYEDKIKYEGFTGAIPTVYQNPEQYGEGTNWLNEIIRTAPIQNYSLSVSNAKEKSSTNVIAGYFNQEGILKNTQYQRYTLRVNSEFRPIEKLRLGFNIAPSLQVEHNNRLNDAGRNYIGAAILSSPLINAVNPDGSMPTAASSPGMLATPNWYRKLIETQDDYKTNRLIANAFAEVDLLKGLKFKTRLDGEMLNETYKNFTPGTSNGGSNQVVSLKAGATYSAFNYRSWTNENTLNYQTKIKDHSIEALAGFTAQKYRSDGISMNATDFADDVISNLQAAATVTKGTNLGSYLGAQTWSLLSLLGRLNYNYKGRYLLSGTLRRDGSSRFGADRKWGVFPSVSAGWVASEENFMRHVPVINYLKLRASYGVVGNNNIGNYPGIAVIGSSNYVISNTLALGLSPSNLGNSLLGWERTNQFDAGLDIGLFNNRLLVAYDYYHKITDGLLYQIDLPQSSGFSNIQSNLGKFEFWGHEISVSSKNLVGAFKWNTNFNISFNSNMVLQLGNTNTPIGGVGDYDTWSTAVGHPIGQYYGWVFDGVYMNQQQFDTQAKHSTSKVGTVRMKDLNNDGVINSLDKTFIGDPNPDFLLGLTNDFNYKRFDFNIAFSGAVGAKMRDGWKGDTGNLDGAFNMDPILMDRWRSEANPGNGIIPSTRAGTTAFQRSSNTYYLDKGNYFLTCKNISLGYTFKLPQLKYMKSARVYTSIQQAFILSNYDLLNPEVGGLNGLSQGNDYFAYPVPRTISFGLSLGL